MGTAEGGSEAEKKPRKTPILLHEPIRTGCVCEARDRERECFPDLPDNSLTHTHVYTHTHTCTHLHNTHICTCSCAPTWTHRHTSTHWCAPTLRCTHPLTGVHAHRNKHSAFLHGTRHIPIPHLSARLLDHRVPSARQCTALGKLECLPNIRPRTQHIAVAHKTSIC